MTLITKTELKAFREDFQKDVKTGKLWKSSNDWVYVMKYTQPDEHFGYFIPKGKQK